MGLEKSAFTSDFEDFLLNGNKKLYLFTEADELSRHFANEAKVYKALIGLLIAVYGWYFN